MRDTARALLSLGGRYFEPIGLGNFVAKVDGLDVSFEREFFQLRQEGNDLTLEYGALLPRAIIDITMTTIGTTELLLRRSSIVKIYVRRAAERVDLRIDSNSSDNLSYHAFTKQARENLLRYAAALETAILAGIE